MKEILSIDLNFGSGSSVEKSEAIKGIRAACSETRFFSIVNHDLSEEVLNSCWQDALDFFNLPKGEKIKNGRALRRVSLWVCADGTGDPCTLQGRKGSPGPQGEFFGRPWE
jgi:Isopenicillin N synthase and related dioxygenases